MRSLPSCEVLSLKIGFEVVCKLDNCKSRASVWFDQALPRFLPLQPQKTYSKYEGRFSKLVSMEGRVSVLLGCLRHSRTVDFFYSVT